MKLVTLIENTTGCEALACEHGLSLYIESGSHRLLFDAGQSGAFARNAEKLGVDLKTVDLAVLSHGHYDHGGGLARFLRINDHAPVYLSQYAFDSHYNASGNAIGLDPALKESGRLRFTRGKTPLAPGLTLHCLSCPPAYQSGMTAGDPPYPEDFRHEQYLLVEEGGKRILVSGCSHKGIVNIAAHFQPDILIGGFHFMKIGDEAVLQAAAEELLHFPTVYYTGHCTGEAQFVFLKNIMGDRLHGLSTGTILELL